jgi:hypothetical protein
MVFLLVVGLWLELATDTTVVLRDLAAVMGRYIPSWLTATKMAHLNGMVVATIVFNATGSRVGGPVATAWHGLMPVLFVIGVEAVRRLILHATRLANNEVTDRIPLHRWMLAPAPTARLYRRMRLANVTSYDEMIKREQALDGYRVWLTQELGGDLSKASEVQRLPMTLAPKGFTVDQALALLAQWETEAAERARAEPERAALAEAEAAERAAELEIKKLKSAGRVEFARHQVQAETGTAAADAEAVTAQAQARAESARTRAELTRVQAERAAAAELESLESAEAAAARRRAAEDKKKAATAEAEAERLRAAEARRRIAVMEAEAARPTPGPADPAPRSRPAGSPASSSRPAGTPTTSTSSRSTTSRRPWAPPGPRRASCARRRRSCCAAATTR